MVLVDTSIWSLAYRRRHAARGVEEEQVREELAELARQGRAQLIGPVRQELLSGIRSESQFEKLRAALRGFDEVTLLIEDYEDAARFDNRCRSNGIAGSAINLLICAVAVRRDWAVFTSDPDFDRYARILPIRLHPPS